MRSVQLFATCLGDLAFPEAVTDAEALLRQAGFEVEFPARQVCCGQPAFNAGHRAAARRVARSFGRAFSREAPIVAPSGSCATMASHYLPELLGVEPFEVWELSAFLASVGFRPLPRNAGRRIAYHDSCHMLRELHVSAQPRRLLGGSGAELVPFARPDLCCGFGGTFSVRQPEVSLAMADEKLAGGEAAGDDRDRRPRLPDAPARPRREDRLTGSSRPPRDRARQGRRWLTSPSPRSGSG